ncbi:DNA internalization-related competence protein ComEC/Rec2 [Kaarinaea lacus]
MIQLASIGFLAGVLICQSLADLPSIEWSLFLIPIIPLAICFPKYRPVFFVCIGFLYSVLIAHDKIAGQISPTLEGKDLLVNGIVSSLPNKNSDRTRFQLDVMDLSELQEKVTQKTGSTSITGQVPRRIQISWYKTAPQISVGQHWQLVVRLKRPHGFSNPGGFDYEAWLYQHDIHATGYVRDLSKTRDLNRLIGVDDSWNSKVHQLREYLSRTIAMRLPENTAAGFISALVVGDRQAIVHEQWRVLTGTGTSHLMAISGLHIGLVAGLAFFLFSQLWRRVPKLSLYIATPRAAALCAMMAALVYAALAGFTLPTQRALIMVAVAMMAIWSQRSLIPSQILAIALVAVLLYDPSAVISGSFWLSFGAVATIFYTMVGRLNTSSWWWKWGRVQWMIAVGLAPILLFWFQQVPLVSPVANLVAVPLVSFITVPLSLLSGLLILLWGDLAYWTLWLAALSLDALWPLLNSLSRLDQLLWITPKPPSWTLLPALIGLVWILAPRGVPSRWLGIFWLLPLVFFPKQPLDQGMARLTLLDVGHGLAVVIQTSHHVLLYDTGPRYSDQFDAGSAVVVPYLRSQGIASIDRLILSHDDMDHTGGYASVMQHINVINVMQSVNIPLQNPDVEFCTAGKQWRWDGVEFSVLHPGQGFQDERDNNMSCVVQITTRNAKLLLTGDIERQVEAQLVKYFARNDDNLRADVLVVPHHGSRSSSSEQFVHAVTPKLALISVGYRNRYGLPKEEVLEQYRGIDATILDTNRSGAISITLGSDQILPFELYREEHRRYWSK